MVSPAFTGHFLGYMLAFVVSTTFARYLQAFVAYQLGDRLPRSEGRLSLRPGRHLDALGVLLSLFVALGVPAIAWGKPLNLNPYGNRLKRPGEALIAFCGPLGYFLMAALGRLIYALLFSRSTTNDNQFAQIVSGFVIGSLVYAAFDLLPLPPLDAWRILKGLWPPAWDVKVVWVETYAVPIVLLVTFILPAFININILGQYYFSPLVDGLSHLIGL